MIVFKNYFKIVKSFLPTIILFTVIFCFFAVFSSSSSGSNQIFTEKKAKIVIVNQDKKENFSKNIEEFLSKNMEIVELDSSETSLKDALFYREVDCVIVIPKNFAKDFFLGKNPLLHIRKVPDSGTSQAVEMLINRYITVADGYTKLGIAEEQMYTHLEKDFKQKVEVQKLTETQNSLEQAQYFYNFSNYVFLALTILIIGMIMTTYNHSSVHKRNLVSSVSIRKMNAFLFLGNFCFTILLWLFYVVLSMILYGNTMFTWPGYLLIINSFVFMIVCLSLGFLLGSFVKNKEAQNGIVNVIALGFSFICGAFVPQQLLGSFVLGIARLLPSYWFIKNNDEIILLSKFDWNSFSPIVMRMVVLLGFAILFFLITNLVSRIKRKNS